ncbi:hypothetical protein ElyMa_004236100 [Elysia marginata]|uniref:Uncharacterized protein n=1 Tax=Elysia marginata TaxID=1093978 RepID=A0AAV4GU71_9GAST|nr:hypothetical protein ElyMa_004236100 [Elysia marginata]
MTDAPKPCTVVEARAGPRYGTWTVCRVLREGTPASARSEPGSGLMLHFCFHTRVDGCCCCGWARAASLRLNFCLQFHGVLSKC